MTSPISLPTGWAASHTTGYTDTRFTYTTQDKRARAVLNTHSVNGVTFALGSAHEIKFPLYHESMALFLPGHDPHVVGYTHRVAASDLYQWLADVGVLIEKTVAGYTPGPARELYKVALSIPKKAAAGLNGLDTATSVPDARANASWSLIERSYVWRGVLDAAEVAQLLELTHEAAYSSVPNLVSHPLNYPYTMCDPVDPKTGEQPAAFNDNLAGRTVFISPYWERGVCLEKLTGTPVHTVMEYEDYVEYWEDDKDFARSIGAIPAMDYRRDFDKFRTVPLFDYDTLNGYHDVLRVDFGKYLAGRKLDFTPVDPSTPRKPVDTTAWLEYVRTWGAR